MPGQATHTKMIQAPTTNAALSTANQIATIGNQAINEITALHAGRAGITTTAQIEQEMGPVAVAQIKTLIAAASQVDPVKHAAAQAALH